jgi:hypothetical protein
MALKSKSSTPPPLPRGTDDNKLSLTARGATPPHSALPVAHAFSRHPLSRIPLTPTARLDLHLPPGQAVHERGGYGSAGYGYCWKR